ncbi:MAG: efflux RND transporter periplasmic adaptor subunit [Planctomycetes bacterium]|nr:efflux RND transporter periplasmic adaptor subunit [Planctomycetota bacterium]
MSIQFLRRAIPTLMVFTGLAGIAFWGHRSGWTLPKSLTAKSSDAKAKDDWCEPHSVPESICVECNETLMPRPKAKGWCKEHRVHECTLCNPEVAQLATPYVVTDGDRARAKRALELERADNAEKCNLHHRRIQFASVEAAERTGLGVERVEQKEIRETIPVSGEIVNDPSRIAHLSSRAPGTVAKVFRHLGDRVAEGEILALVEAAEVGKAKTEFSQATLLLDVKQKARGRLTSSSSEAAVALADAALREASVRFRAARQALLNLGLPQTNAEHQLLDATTALNLTEAELSDRLHYLGIPDKERKDLRATLSNHLLPLRAPIAGIIASRDMVPGEVVDPTRMLIEIIDQSHVWLVLDVRSEDVAKIKLDHTKILFTPDGHKEEVAATVTWISIDADEKTRTIKARAELANPGNKLRARTFGTGKLVLREEKKAFVVPNSAVHWEGDCHVVFVRDKNWFKEGSYKVYHTRVVRVGMRDDEKTEIIAGVLPGEWVATKGSEVLRAELLRGNFGEGCGCCKK